MFHPLCHSSHNHQTLVRLTFDSSKPTNLDLFGEEGLKTNMEWENAGNKIKQFLNPLKIKCLKNL